MSVNIQHEFRPSANPRLAERCACGRTEAEHPKRPAPLTRPRSIEHERKLIEDAARGVVDPARLIQFREQRIQAHSQGYVANPLLVSLEHDKRQMALEELGDCANYLAWFLQENPEDPRVPEFSFALRHVVLAFDLIS